MVLIGLLLSRDDFGIVQESGSRILTFILDRAIVSAVEVGILQWNLYSRRNNCLEFPHLKC